MQTQEQLYLRSLEKLVMAIGAFYGDDEEKMEECNDVLKEIRGESNKATATCESEHSYPSYYGPSFGKWNPDEDLEY